MVAHVEIGVHDLARPVGLVVCVRMIGAVADEGEIAPVGILAAETVTAAGKRHRPGRGRAAARSGHRLMQRLDRLPVGDLEHDAHHRGLRAAMQAEDVVIAAGAAEIDGVVARFDATQTPHVFVKTRRFVEIGGNELDAAQAADEALRHFRLFSRYLSAQVCHDHARCQSPS